MLLKNQSIISLLAGLRVRMGKDAFDVVDYWDGDLCAIGIARADNHCVLVYISTHGKSPGRYFVSLELPTAPDSDHPYAPADQFDEQTFEDVVRIIQRHLSSCP